MLLQERSRAASRGVQHLCCIRTQPISAVSPSLRSYWRGTFNSWFEAEVVSVEDELEVDPKRPHDIPDPTAFYVLLQ